MTQPLPSIYNGWGAVRFPLDADQADYRSGATQADPGLMTLGELLESAAQAELGTQWGKVVTALPQENPIRGCFDRIIGSKLYQPPEPHQLTQAKVRWPLLAVYRTGDPEEFDITLEKRAIRQSISVDLILGPCDIATQRRLAGFLTAFRVLVGEVVRQGRHPNYASGVRQFAGQFCSLKTMSHQGPGVMQPLGTDAGGGYFGISIRLEAIEREMNSSGGSTLEFEMGYLTLETMTGDLLEGIDATAELEPEDIPEGD